MVKKYTCTYVFKHFSFTCKSRLRNVDVNKSVVNDVKREEKTAQKLIDCIIHNFSTSLGR